MAYSKSKPQYKSKYQVQQETSPTVDILCSGVSYDFTTHPRYGDINAYAHEEVRKEDEEEMRMMIEDGAITSPEEYNEEYATPEKNITERVNRYMLNVTDLPTDVVLVGIDRDLADNEQYLMQAIYDKYGYSATAIKAHELSSEKDTLSQKTYEAVGNVYETDDYKKYLDLTAFWKKYSVNNVALILAQRPDAQAVKTYGGCTKDGTPYGWWAEGRGVATGAQGIKLWQPNTKVLKTEKQVETYLKFHPEYGKSGDTFDQKKQALMQEIAQNGGSKEVIDGFKLGVVFDIMDTVPREGKEDNLQELLDKIHLKKPLTENMDNFPVVVECMEKALDVPKLNLPSDVLQQEALYRAVQDYAEEVLRTKPESIMGIKSNEPLEGDMHKMETMMTAYLVAKHLGIECDDKIAFELSGIMKNEMSDQMLHVGKRAMFTTAHDRAAKFSKQIAREFDKAYEPYRVQEEKQQNQQKTETAKTPTLFTCALSVAVENNQKREWVESKNLNEECQSDIVQAIRENSAFVNHGQTVNYRAALEKVMNKYDTERISLVLAHDVIHTEDQLDGKMIDGRYHREVQDWAKATMQSYPDISFKIFPNTIISDKSHPIIVDSLISEYTDVLAEMQKEVEKAQKHHSKEAKMERD